MRIRTPTALTVLGAVVGMIGVGLIGVGVIGYAPVVAARDAITSHLSAFVVGPRDTLISGVRAPGGSVIDAPAPPIIVTPDQLAAGGPVTMRPGQALYIVLDADPLVREGGSSDDDVLRFGAADGVGDASFFALEPGTATAWVVGAGGWTVTFGVTVVSS
ncbi:MULTISPECIES: hypothetical protein [Microbacterium]|uniref:hypothetical protein n=1 Tax=Microbacterium TaxID=33882 RepID=UPI0027847436|nr:MULTISPECIES: hypothetical protein [Microbacterium]MDQ1085138.1 hypothetical protein [Microbacterium sp. SORGH_AS_0344]MDQ1169556.1 hypothetical protein [Microbacterium proteolyticum]